MTESEQSKIIDNMYFSKGGTNEYDKSTVSRRKRRERIQNRSDSVKMREGIKQMLATSPAPVKI